MLCSLEWGKIGSNVQKLVCFTVELNGGNLIKAKQINCDPLKNVLLYSVTFVRF